MTKMGMLLLLALVTTSSTMWVMSMAQSSGCTNVLISLSPCLNYITGNTSTPSSGCCTQLSSVIQKDPQCLCQVINGGGGSSMISGMNINQTQALNLPSACKISSPPISRCNGAASPSGSPTERTPTTTNGGSKTTPTTQGNSSNANKSKLSPVALSLLWALFFIGSRALAQ